MNKELIDSLSKLGAAGFLGVGFLAMIYIQFENGKEAAVHNEAVKNILEKQTEALQDIAKIYRGD